jgi:hypothetical protein
MQMMMVNVPADEAGEVEEGGGDMIQEIVE